MNKELQNSQNNDLGQLESALKSDLRKFKTRKQTKAKRRKIPMSDEEFRRALRLNL